MNFRKINLALFSMLILFLAIGAVSALNLDECSDYDSIFLSDESSNHDSVFLSDESSNHDSISINNEDSVSLSDMVSDSTSVSINEESISSTNSNQSFISTSEDSAVSKTMANDSIAISSNSILKANSNILINDKTYSTYFNGDGTLKNSISGETTLIIENTTNKNFIFNQTIHIAGNGNGIIKNGRILLYPNASNSTINNIKILYENLSNTTFNGLISLDTAGGSTGFNNVSITNCTLSILNSTSGLDNFIQAIHIYCNSSKMSRNLNIINNTINVYSNALTSYGIAVYTSNADNVKSAKGVNISGNTINISSSQYSKPLFLHNIENLEISNNTIFSSSYLDSSDLSLSNNISKTNAYGLSLIDVKNLSCKNNTIDVKSSNNAYGAYIEYNDVSNFSDNEMTVEGNAVYIISSFYSNTTLLINNTLTGMGNYSYGYFGSSAFNDTIRANYFEIESNYNNSKILPSGIEYYYFSANSTILGNFIYVNCDNGEIYGIILNTALNDSNMSVENNFILSNKGEGTEYIHIYNFTDDISLYENVAFSINENVSGIDKILIKSNSSNNMAQVLSANIKRNTTILFENMSTTVVRKADGRVGEYFTATLLDQNGNILKNKALSIGFNGKVYNRLTNSTGGVRLQINLAVPGGYTFALSFLGDDEYNACFGVAVIRVNKKISLISVSVKNVKTTSKTKTKTFTIKLYDNKTKGVLSSSKITFTINGKTYSRTTNSNGLATVKVTLTIKKSYRYTVKFAGTNVYKNTSKIATIKV